MSMSITAQLIPGFQVAGPDLFPKWILIAFAAAWGAVWGSFATVIIWRYPREESIVSPSSRCPACLAPIRWFDNIPIIGYLLLGGKCRRCKEKISPMYPSVEIICILLALTAFFLHYSPEGSILLFLSRFFITFTFFWSLFVISVVDIRSYLVPDIITLPGIVLFLTYNLIVARQETLQIALAVVGSYLVVFVFFNFFYRVLAGTEGMGMGDAKLLAMIAALAGWQGALFSLIAGAAQGLIVNTPLLLYKKRKEKPASEAPGEGERKRAFLKTQVPFGPMLSLGAFEYILWGDEIIDAYIVLADKMALMIT